MATQLCLDLDDPNTEFLDGVAFYKNRADNWNLWWEVQSSAGSFEVITADVILQNLNDACYDWDL